MEGLILARSLKVEFEGPDLHGGERIADFSVAGVCPPHILASQEAEKENADTHPASFLLFILDPVFTVRLSFLVNFS